MGCLKIFQPEWVNGVVKNETFWYNIKLEWWVRPPSKYDVK